MCVESTMISKPLCNGNSSVLLVTDENKNNTLNQADSKSEDVSVIKRPRSAIIGKPSQEEMKQYLENNNLTEDDIGTIRLPWHRTLLKTSQPAHFVTMVVVLSLAAVLYPINNPTAKDSSKPQLTPITAFVYLSCFAMHFGSQMWMTFVSGLSLFFNLSRHTFGQVQVVLFPRYYLMSTILSATILYIFLQQNPIAMLDFQAQLQVVALVACFTCEMVTTLYLSPPMLKLVKQKTELEKAAGVGHEVGHHDLGKLRYCPHYILLNRAFRKYHTSIAIGNLVTVGCSVFHLYYFANKLCSI